MAGVMIVDDEEDILSLYSEMMGVFGHEVLASATNGEEAVNRYRDLEKKPDLIIIDQQMPLKNGLDTATEILSMNPDEKIVFVSADSSVRKDALNIGVVEFLEKPFPLQAFRDMLNRYEKEEEG